MGLAGALPWDAGDGVGFRQNSLAAITLGLKEKPRGGGSWLRQLKVQSLYSNSVPSPAPLKANLRVAHNCPIAIVTYLHCKGIDG